MTVYFMQLKALGLPVPEICVDKCRPDWREKLAQANSKKVKTETGADQIHADVSTSYAFYLLLNFV